MNAIFNNRVYMRSLATRGSRTELSASIGDVLDVVRVAGYDLIIVETSGIGQGDAEITKYTDLSMYVMTSEFGAPTQLEKIDMIDFADVIAINKFERKGSEDALRQVQKQYQRSRELWDESLDSMPVYGTIASQFNDKGTNALFAALVKIINEKQALIGKQAMSNLRKRKSKMLSFQTIAVIIYVRLRTLSVAIIKTEQQVGFARRLFQLEGAIAAVQEKAPDDALVASLTSLAEGVRDELTAESKRILDNWQALKEAYAGDEFVTKVRDKEIRTILKQLVFLARKFQK